MNLLNRNIAPRSASNTMDAWFLIYVSFGLYFVFSIVLAKMSILGARPLHPVGLPDAAIGHPN